jgi:hypothetical protein
MESFAFQSDSLSDTEEFLNLNYTKTRIGNDTGRPVRTTITRTLLGPVDLDDFELRFDMSYNAQPLGKICLCHVETGAIDRRVIRPHGAGRPGLARTTSTTVSRAVCGGGR